MSHKREGPDAVQDLVNMTFTKEPYCRPGYRLVQQIICGKYWWVRDGIYEIYFFFVLSL